MKLTEQNIKEWLEPNEATKQRWKEMDKQREAAQHQQAMEHFLRERARMERRNLIRDLFGL